MESPVPAQSAAGEAALPPCARSAQSKNLRSRLRCFILSNMKIFPLSLLWRLVWLITAFTGSANAERILFIGNSYTGVNNLPKIYQQIVTSMGAPAPDVSAVTPGGKTLEQHLSQEKTLKLIDEGNWDVVVLQGQSQEAAVAQVSEPIRTSFLNSAKSLCERIKSKSPKAKIVFYQTWARHADYWNNPKADTNVGKNAKEMQSRNHASYQKAAAQTAGSIVAPVGDAWELQYANPKALRLHRQDNSHPEFSGSYLAGLVLYATIHPAAKLAVSFQGELSEADASALQKLAGQVCASGH
jgi:hypothetical protein